MRRRGFNAGLWLLLAIGFVVALIWATDGGLIGDEWVHVPQIQAFARGDFIIEAQLTTIPGYHLVVAAWVWLIGADSLAAMRAFNAMLGLLTVAIFYQLRRRSGDAAAGLATAQFLALPVLFPFFFLAYTDVLSVALVLAAAAATLATRHRFSALLLLCALAVRQNNIIWVGLLAVMAAWPIWHASGLRGWRSMLALGWPYGIDVAAFLAFWYWNGSISLSTAQVHAHPDLALHPGNVFFALFVLALLLPLQLAEGLRTTLVRARAQPRLWLLPLLGFALYWWGFAVDHPYNLIDPRWSWRNRFLQAVATEPWLRVGFGVIAVSAACGLAGIRLRPAGALWLYPFALLFLASSWLIETRYVLIPLALLLAFREHSTLWVERATGIIWAAMAAFVFYVLMNGGPFL